MASYNEICPISDLTCKSVPSMAKSITKCNGLLFCYESQLTNQDLIGKYFKLNELYNIRPGNSERMCYSDKMEIQMNGFAIYYNLDYKTTEVIMDIAGRRYKQINKNKNKNKDMGQSYLKY
uniref:Uncharacterized protein n=1 Tax=Meloidogyne hapla TaxID=6305 RepID=A0A1I8BWN4_MELHA